MAEISYRRHRSPPVVIQHAVWLYLHFTLSYRDVEDLLAERGLDISYETVRSWVLKFGHRSGTLRMSQISLVLLGGGMAVAAGGSLTGFGQTTSRPACRQRRSALRCRCLNQVSPTSA